MIGLPLSAGTDQATVPDAKPAAAVTWSGASGTNGPASETTSVRETPELFVNPPAAKQVVAPVHATPKRRLSRLPWLGLGVIVQAVPSQVSTSVRQAEEGSRSWPTATHALAPTHETLLRTLEPAPWLGLGAIVHAVPSHVWTSVSLPESPWALPTATQLVVVVHDTPPRALRPVPWL